MQTWYNRIAGQNLERLAALSDGIFAVAMTLLVLDIHPPASALVNSEQQFWQMLGHSAPQCAMFLMGFLTLGIFWNGQQTQINHFIRADRNLVWIHLAFLALICLMPFSTSLLAQFITYRGALLVYWSNILLLGLVLYWGWRYARKAGLVKDDVSYETSCAIEKRIIIAQSLYLLGALLCFYDTALSIGFIFLVQLNYAVAPRIRFLERL